MSFFDSSCCHLLYQRYVVQLVVNNTATVETCGYCDSQYQDYRVHTFLYFVQRSGIFVSVNQSQSKPNILVKQSC